MVDIKRTTKNIFGVLSSFGGILKILQSSLSVIIFPISQYSLLLTMIKRMYFAKTEKDDIFKGGKSEKSFFVKKRRSDYLNFNNLPESLKNTGFKEDVKTHRYIQLSCSDNFLLFLHYYIPCLIKISCWKKKHTMTRMLKKARKRVYRNLNVFKILTRLSDVIQFQQFRQVLD